MGRFFASRRRAILLPLAILLAAAQPAPAPGITRGEAAAALSVLENPKSRDAFIATLRAIVAAPPTAPPEAATSPSPAAAAAAAGKPGEAAGKPPAQPVASLPLKPDSLGEDLLVTLASNLNAAAQGVMAGLKGLISLPLLTVWFAALWNSPYLGAQLFNVGWRLVLVIGAGLLAEWLAIRALALPRRALVRRAAAREVAGDGRATPPLTDPVAEGEARAEAGETEPPAAGGAALAHLSRAGFAVLGFLIDLAAIVIFAAVANGLLAAGVGGETTIKLSILAIADAYVVARVLLSLIRMLMGAEAAQLRIIPLRNDAAAYAVLWARRVIGVTVFGYIATEIALLFGLYPSLHLALIKLVMLVVHLLLAVIAFQQRRHLAAIIRAPAGATGPVAAFRNLIAALWHWVVIFYLVGLWFVWAIGIPHRYHVLIRFGVVTAIVIALAWLADRGIWRLVAPRVRIRSDIAERLPGFERRARHYVRGLRRLISCVVGIVAFLILLDLWGLDAFAWFAAGSLGGRVLSAVVVIGITILVALFLWELANTSIDKHLARLSHEGQAARSARLRTLLPMLRTSIVIVIAVVVGLMVLAQLGVNTAPLLAGAGVIGIAVGFGSQKLVQDIINGLFLLFENAMQVGDVVSLGGLSGVVENLSVRTIRLRAADGSVHIVPFSSVATVTNQTRDFGYAVFNIGVAYKEDIDHVLAVLKEIGHDMRQDPGWAPMIRDDLEISGLDQFAASSVVIACRLRTGPTDRWSVMREFNRRMKRRFDELGIEMPFPHQKLVLDQPLSVYLPEESGRRHERPPWRAVP